MIFTAKSLYISKKSSNFAADSCKDNKIKEINMARPIRETPILFGDEARRFETQMLNPKPLSAERQARMQSDYEFLRSRCVNCAF